ncbi:MAG: hypothetical protein MK108_03065 [Mariniblastus sp.]|nr:hypothetical protein [Mariniblastus sp.]
MKLHSWLTATLCLLAATLLLACLGCQATSPYGLDGQVFYPNSPIPGCRST